MESGTYRSFDPDNEERSGEIKQRPSDDEPNYVFEVHTERNDKYKFFPANEGFMQFVVQVGSDAYICLAYAAKAHPPLYEIKIGVENNTKSSIYKDSQQVVVANTEGYLSKSEYKGFWIRWGNKSVVVGRRGQYKPFLIYNDEDWVPIHYVGFRTPHCLIGDWCIEGITSPPPNPPLGAGGEWVYAKRGKVPPNAVLGGEEDGRVSYVARVFTDDGVLPGKLVRGDKCAYYPVEDDSKAGASADYQVLCNFMSTWKPASDGNVPEHAFIAGRTFDGEDLYVCRVTYKGKLVPGFVHPSTKSCFFTYLTESLRHSVYEVLCHK